MGPALGTYRCDPEPLLRRAGLDPEKLSVPGWRFPLSSMTRLWELALEEVKDPGFGLQLAEQVRPAHLHALGLAWMVSSSVADAMQRLVRYHDIISTAASIELRREGSEYTLGLTTSEQVHVEAVGAFFGSILSLSLTLAGGQFAPLRVDPRRDNPGAEEAYRQSYRPR